MGDFFCRVCEVAVPLDLYESMPKINPMFKYCFCCHVRMGTGARSKCKYKQYLKTVPELKSFKDLGMVGIKRQLMGSIDPRDKQLLANNTYYQRNKERRLEYFRQYYWKKKQGGEAVGK